MEPNADQMLLVGMDSNIRMYTSIFLMTMNRCLIEIFTGKLNDKSEKNKVVGLL